MKSFKQYLLEAEQHQYQPLVGDTVSFQINEELEITSEVTEIIEEGIVLNLDETSLNILCGLELVTLTEASEKTPRDKGGSDYWYGRPNQADQYSGKEREEYQAGWDEMERQGERKDYGIPKYHRPHRRSIDEAEYKGRKVQLGKPMRTTNGPKKFSVYVKNPKTGNVKKVNFGDPKMEIKRDDPKRRKNFRARHGCGTNRASDRTKAAYWSCKMWSNKPVSKLT